MTGDNLVDLLVGKGDDARVEIARRVGHCLSVDDLPLAERRAAEALAGHLVRDAAERVRCELSHAVRQAPYLSREVALTLAHDIDAVACPFLAVTEVFSESEWHNLVLTVSRGARIAAAGRTSMSEGLAVALAETGDTAVAQALIENAAAPMTQPVCDPLMERYESAPWILDKLAERDDLMAEAAAQLITRVSTAAREKLAAAYDLPNRAASITADAESGALLQLIREVPASRVLSFAQQVQREGRLNYPLLVMALRDGSLGFFEIGLSLVSGTRVETIRAAIHHGSDGALTAMLSRAGIPRGHYADIWELLQWLRGRLKLAQG
ncbi:MAG: DUF2336 domain-containing protein [Hyphomicrobiales bacterium]